MAQEGERRREELEAARGPMTKSKLFVTGIYLLGTPFNALPDTTVTKQLIASHGSCTQGGLFLDSVGYGMESKHDVGDTVRLQLEGGAVPTPVLNAMRGMREGGKRRIVATPNFG